MMLTSTQIGELAAQFFIAGAGTLSFAVLFGCRAKPAFCGWWCRGLVRLRAGRDAGADSAAASLLAVVPLTLLTRVFAITLKMPVTVFLLSRHLPAGAPARASTTPPTISFRTKNALALAKGISTFKIAVALAIGISLVLCVPLPKRK